MKRLLLFIPLILFLAVFALFDWGVDQEGDRNALESARLNQPVPAFQLTRLEDGTAVNQSQLQGQPMLLNVWATWCPSCHVEHPYLLQLAQEKGVAIVGLNYKDDRDAALQWLGKLGDPYSLNVFDPEGRLGLDLGVYGAPETYVIDPQGVIRYRHVGVVDEKVWTRILEPIMREHGYRPKEDA